MNEFEPSYFFFKLPLYTPIGLTSDNIKDFESIMSMGRGIHNISFEGYNPFRKQESTFTGYSPTDESFLQKGGVAKLVIRCKRYDDRISYLILNDGEKSIAMKVGQYPSIADFHIYELNRYNKVLDKPKLKEISRAIGLAANGVGIGSFVYLRRIFEYLIFTSFSEHKDGIGINEAKFMLMRIDDKIQLLKDFLPKFLVENKSIYSILSLGIHELNEEDCLAYFDTLRVGIEIILDEKLEAALKLEKIKIAQQKLSDLNIKLKK